MLIVSCSHVLISCHHWTLRRMDQSPTQWRPHPAAREASPTHPPPPSPPPQSPPSTRASSRMLSLMPCGPGTAGKVPNGSAGIWRCRFARRPGMSALVREDVTEMFPVLSRSSWNVILWCLCHVFIGMGSSDEFQEIFDSTPELDMCVDPRGYGGGNRYKTMWLHYRKTKNKRSGISKVLLPFWVSPKRFSGTTPVFLYI